MPKHQTLTAARICQHLLRFPSSLSHRVLMKVLDAAFQAGRAYERRANGGLSVAT